jgi:hypothetical protein
VLPEQEGMWRGEEEEGVTTQTKGIQKRKIRRSWKQKRTTNDTETVAQTENETVK